MRFLFAATLAALFVPAIAPAQTLEKIKQSGQLVIGFRADAAPLSFLAEGGPKGYTPAVCFEMAPSIAKSAGLEDMEVIFETVTTEDRFDKIASGEIDLLCGAASITLSRREIVDFSTPVYVDGTTVALKKGAPDTFKELAGKKIGVRSGTTTLESLENSLKAEGIEAEVIQFDDHPSGMAALEGDAITAYFADQSILMNMVMNNANPDAFKVSTQILTVEKHGLAMRRGDSDFRLAVDTALTRLYNTGKIRKAFDQFIPAAEPGLALEAMFLLSPTIR